MMRTSAILLVCLSAGSAWPGEPKTLFEETFQERLDSDWAWVRENPKAWRLEKGTLVIDTQRGSLWMKGNNSKNLLLRPAPQRKDGFAFEALLESQPKKQFEHAGILCYYDDDNYVALNKEYLNRTDLVLISEANSIPHLPCPEKEYEGKQVWLRMVVGEGKVVGQYRAGENESWQTIGERPLPLSQKPLKIGLHSGIGTPKGERQARFRGFRVLEK